MQRVLLSSILILKTPLKEQLRKRRACLPDRSRHRRPGDRGGTPAVEEQPAPTPSPAEETRVNLNTATSEALQTLETIGPSTAQRIIDDRETQGPFATVEEITRVKGIGQKTLDKIRARVVV